MEFVVEALIRLTVTALKLFELHTLAQFFRGKKTTLERCAEKHALTKKPVPASNEKSRHQAPQR